MDLIQLHIWYYDLKISVQTLKPSIGLKIQINMYSLIALAYNPFLPANQ